MNAHPTREEDFDLYALGALEGDEKQAIETHIAQCADCAHKLAAARGRMALLSLAAPRVEPSSAVKRRLLAQVRADTEGDVRIGTSPVNSRAMQSRVRGSGFFTGWRTAILVPALTVLVIATAWLWNQNRLLNIEVAHLGDMVKTQQRGLVAMRDAVDFMESHDTVTVALAPQPGQPQGAAHVMYNTKMGMLMYEGEIAPAPAAKSYELWVIPTDGKPINAGVFNPVTGRADHWMMKMPPGVAPRMFAVTLEPQGGMPQPTGPMILIGHA
ncbi:MAG: anti-sigma factor [Candidatus Acidiferrales bacterium]